MKQRKQDDLNDIIASENLKADETDKFMANTFPLRSKNKKYKECNRTPYVFYVYIKVLADV